MVAKGIQPLFVVRSPNYSLPFLRRMTSLSYRLFQAESDWFTANGGLITESGGGRGQVVGDGGHLESGATKLAAYFLAQHMSVKC